MAAMIKILDKNGKAVPQEKFPETMSFSALERYRARLNAGSQPSAERPDLAARKKPASAHIK